jgi:hypothetical protein
MIRRVLIGLLALAAVIISFIFDEPASARHDQFDRPVVALLVSDG